MCIVRSASKQALLCQQQQQQQQQTAVMAVVVLTVVAVGASGSGSRIIAGARCFASLAWWCIPLLFLLLPPLHRHDDVTHGETRV